MPSAEYSWPQLLSTLIAHKDLDTAAAGWAMDEIMSGNADDVALAGFLVALRSKGETVEELTGLANSMLDHAVPLPTSPDAVDIVGTGGDRSFTVNISTMASLVIAACGARVVKHGNRAASSKSGSADVLEALGVNLELPVEGVARVVDEVGITFCFARLFHPSMRFVGGVRSGLGVATVFNFLGPLTNPARVRAAAIGCADRRMAPLMAGVLASRGTDALVFRGENDGLDELAATSPARIWEITGGLVKESVLDPVADLGLHPITVADLRGDDAAHNAHVARDIFAGQGTQPIRETVLLNAAAGLAAYGTAPGLENRDEPLADRLRRGIDIAAKAVDEGKAADVLNRWAAATTA